MILRSTPFRRVTIVGTGLMGGSLGLAIKKHKLAKEVVGLSQKQSSLVHAIKCKVIDVGETNIQKAIKNADLVVLATPVDSIISLFAMIKPYLKRGCFVTDLGSAKVEIVEKAEAVLPMPGNFLGSHPLVGSEKTGVENADAQLFQGSTCILTPTKKTTRSTQEKMKLLWSTVGAQVKTLSPTEHDEILGYMSHLPHLISFGLLETIPQDDLEYMTRSLSDSTRIAGSSPQMWNDICLANSKNVLKSLDEFVKQMAVIRTAIINKDQRALVQYFTKVKEKRESIKS